MPTKKTKQPEKEVKEVKKTEVAVTETVADIKKEKAKAKKEKAVKQAKKKAELADTPLVDPTAEVETTVDGETSLNPSDTTITPTEEKVVEPKKVHVRGKKYTEARSKVDKTKQYSIEDAVELIKNLSYSKFVGSVEAHLEVKEAGITATVTFPHTTGKTVRVAIVDAEVLGEINKGIINFDILIAKPGDMKDLTKFARVLGPKGLMPNPKNGTLTPNPEAKKKELEAGAVTLKTEKKAPLVHTLIGKLNMPTKDLAENTQALLKAFTGRTVKLYLCASMSPSVRVAIEK